jgi:hypothetical protein
MVVVDVTARWRERASHFLRGASTFEDVEDALRRSGRDASDLDPVTW